jgi:hypothetical protein
MRVDTYRFLLYLGLLCYIAGMNWWQLLAFLALAWGLDSVVRQWHLWNMQVQMREMKLLEKLAEKESEVSEKSKESEDA